MLTVESWSDGLCSLCNLCLIIGNCLVLEYQSNQQQRSDNQPNQQQRPDNQPNQQHSPDNQPNQPHSLKTVNGESSALTLKSDKLEIPTLQKPIEQEIDVKTANQEMPAPGHNCSLSVPAALDRIPSSSSSRAAVPSVRSLVIFQSFNISTL